MRSNKLPNRIAIACMAAILWIGMAGLVRAQNETLDFRLVNRTGIHFHAIYIAPHTSEDWGEDVMDDDVLRDGESVDISFHPKAKHRFWDLRVEDKEGDSVEWEKLDLSQISVLTLKIAGGKAVAEWE